jgi:hypothetical protein
MVASIAQNSQVGQPSNLVADEISQYVYKSWDELFRMSREEVETFQLRSARRRFEELAPQVAALKEQADRNGVTRIDTLNDLVPLLFDHTVYKSYPMALLENNRFDLLTPWLQRSTTVDLSGVNVSGCKGIDDWLDTLERNTLLQISHTSGSSGKLSFIPRTAMERDLFNHSALSTIRGGFGKEPMAPLGGPNGVRMPVVFPSLRHGRYTAQRFVGYIAEVVAPSPDEYYTLTNGTLSADLVSLSGRVRVAQAKGELSRMKLSEGQRMALNRYIEEQARRPQEMADFFGRMIDKLRGKRIFMFSQTSYLVQASQEGLKRGLSNVFAPDSVGNTAGGGKEIVFPDDWRELVKKFTGIPHWGTQYGMTELIGIFPGCPHHRHHIPPLLITFLLDPVSGALLPRQGTQTGRLAVLDLPAQTYWGGFISGDMVTVEWDSACPCGRKGAFIHNNVERYSSTVTGDDRVNCAATVDNTDAALQKLLAN